MRIFGVSRSGYAVFIENQEPQNGNTITYTFQDSVDGSTWTDIQFTVNNAPQSDFALLPNTTALLKVSSPNPYIRLLAYGDASMAVSVSYQKATPTSGCEVQIFESA